MMFIKKYVSLGLVWGVLCAVPISAQESGAALLGKVQRASQSLNYEGIFIHDQGIDTTNTQITHLVDQDKIETVYMRLMDGQQVEQIRIGKTLKVIDKSDKLVHVEEVDHADQFPGILVSGKRDITPFYSIDNTGKKSRVADRSCFVLRIIPKDRLRYGYELCVDEKTFLLLRVHTIDSNNRVVEKASFASINYNPKATAKEILHLYTSSDWKYEKSEYENMEKMRFSVNPATGFTILRKIRHPWKSGGSVEQYVFTDGLASVSVFLEPIDKGVTLKHKEWEEGSLHILKQQLGQYRLMIVGEVPRETLNVFAQGVRLTP